MSDNIQENDMEGILSSIKNILEEDERTQQMNNTKETAGANNVSDNVSERYPVNEVIELSPDMRVNTSEDIISDDESFIVEASPAPEIENENYVDAETLAVENIASTAEELTPDVETQMFGENDTVAEETTPMNEPFFETDVVEEVVSTNEPFFESNSENTNIDELLNDKPTFDTIPDVFETDIISDNEPSLDELLGTEEPSEVEETAPAFEDLVPEVEETAPAFEELTPEVEETAPAFEELTPEVEETAPVVEELAPEVEETAPAFEELAPVVEETASTFEELAPVVEETAPTFEELAPVVEETAPAVEELAPVVEETAPTVEELAPEVEETAPVVEELAPEVEETAPVVEELAPEVEEKIAVFDPIIEIADDAEEDVVESEKDVSSNIMSNFAKMFSHEEKSDEPKIVSVGNSSKTLEDFVVDAIRAAIGKEISAKWNNGVDFNNFAEAEIRHQVELWITNNMNGLIEDIVKKEVERVIAKVGS